MKRTSPLPDFLYHPHAYEICAGRFIFVRSVRSKISGTISAGRALPFSHHSFRRHSANYDVSHYSPPFHGCSCSAPRSFFWLFITRSVITFFFMPSHLAPSYLFCSQHIKFLSTSSSDLAALTVLLIPSTSVRISFDQRFLPPSLASIPPRLFSISPITSHVGSLPSARWNRSVLLRLPAELFLSAGLSSSSAQLVASATSLFSIS